MALLHWSAIKEVKQGTNKGYADVKLKKLKSTAREVQIKPQTLAKVSEFKRLRGLDAREWPNSQVFDTPNAHAFM